VAKLLLPQIEVRKALEACIRAGDDLTAKADIAERTARYDDWLQLFGTWKKETKRELNRLYEGSSIGQEFEYSTSTSEHSSPRYTFPHAKTAVEYGIYRLNSLLDGLALAVEESQHSIALASLHNSIYSGCRGLYESGEYAEAVEKSFKIVRDRLRALTTYETGSDAFGRGKGNLYIDGATAPHVDEDFQSGVKFLTMAIDRFRNEKSHVADGNISDPIRAYEYLRLSSLAMHLLEGGRVLSQPSLPES
jgi:uncharacterized protein (TIGR02391 family)